MKFNNLNTDFCIENQIYRHSKKNNTIYLIVIIAFIVVVVLLPFIKVDIVIQSNGNIRPIAEKVELKSSITEMVDYVPLHEGLKVKEGDTILTFNTAAIDSKIRYQQEIEQDYQNQVSDLLRFVRNSLSSQCSSPKREQEKQLFERQKDEIKLRITAADKKLSRNKQLYQSGAIAEDEYENYVQEKEKSSKELKTLIDNRLSLWKSDLNTLQNSLNETRSTLNQLYRERKMYIIQAPVNGTLDQFSGIYKGAYLMSGQTLASISPDSTLLIESYVQPKDIGFLHQGMPVNIQVASFNYNQWGMLKGYITDISSDFIISDNNAFYKVKCRVYKNYLQLKTGQRGYLKKGMSVQTRFMITRKSLFQLLYQKFDEWINPAIRTNDTSSKQQASL